MRGALDRCMWAAVARHVRHGPSISRYCTSPLGAGRGRGRAAPSPAPTPAPAAVAPPPSASPSPAPASGIGHGSGGAGRAQVVAGRGRGVGRGIAVPSSAAPPSVVKGRGRGESPIVAARNASAAAAGRGIGPPPTAVSNAGSLGRGKEESKVVAAAASINAKPRKVAAAPAATSTNEKPKKLAAASGSAAGPQQAGLAGGQGAGDGNVGGVPVPKAVNPSVNRDVSGGRVHRGQQSSSMAESAGGEFISAQNVGQVPSSSVPGQPQRAPEVNPAQNLQTSEASEVFAALIQSCVRKGLVLEIDYVYRGMQAAHISATLQTCQTLLETYIQLGNVQKMDLIYMEMREARMGHQKPEASLQEKMEASRTLSALIDSWHSRGFLEEVDLAYKGMKASQLSVGTQTYVALMDTYSRLGNFETMDMVYAEMRGSMTAPATQVSAQPVARGLGAAPPNFQGSGVGHGAPLQSPVMHHQQHLGQPFQGGGQYPPAQMQVAPPSYFQPGPTGYAPPQPQQVVQMQQWPQPNQTTSYPYMHSGQPLNMPGTYYGQGQPQLYPYANMQSAPQNMGYPQSSAPIHPQTQAPMYPGQPGYVQYQTGHPMAYGGAPNAHMPPRPQVQPAVVPPNVSMGQQARPQFHAGAVTPGKQALPNAHVSPRPQGVAPTSSIAMQTQPRPVQHVQATPKLGGLELQPKALELLQQSEYSKLIKEGMVAASGHPVNVNRAVNLQPQSQVNQLTGQPANVTMVHPHLQAPQFGAPGYGRFVSQQPSSQQVPASMGVQYASVQYAPPVVHITPPPTLQGQGVPTVRPIGHAQAQPRPITQQPIVQVTPQPQLQRSVPTLGMPAMQPAPVKEPVGHPVSEPPVQPKPEPKQQAQIPAPKLTPPKPEIGKVSNLKPASSRPETKSPPSEFSDATKAPDVKAEAKPPPLKLELKAQVSKVADVKAEVESTVVEPVAKAPSLKLSSVGRGKAVAASDNVAPVAEEKVPDLPKPPSLKLALGKKPGSPKQAEQPTKAAEDLESPRESTASVSDLELEADEPVAALPSIRRLTGRGRGKTVPTMDPAATILGLHAPSDALLQPEALDSAVEEQDESLPALPFQSRLAGKGRGKALPTPDPGVSAEQQKKVQLLREEAAKRAIAILESGVGKAQMSANLERRKKRFSDQFSFGDFPRRAVEARAGASSKKGKGKQKRLDAGEIEDEVIEYVAPEEYMERDVLTGVEEAIKGTLHRHFMLDLDPEAAMEEFGTNPDIDDKPLPTLEEMLEQAKPQIMSLDGTVDEQQWQDTVEDVKKRAPQLQSLVQAYAGPKKKTAKQKNKELHDIVSKLPPYASPELSAFTKRAMLTLQNNPSWSQNEKARLLNRVVRDFSKF